VVTALIAHKNFANRNQEIHFLKNMAMMGGFLYVAAFGRRCLEFRRTMVAPRSVGAADPNLAARASSQMKLRHRSTPQGAASCNPKLWNPWRSALHE
jgi:hypothetical protein